MKNDENEIRAAIQSFGRALQAMDQSALEGLWDSSYHHLVYQPEEKKRACRTWSEIQDYWSYIPTAVDKIRQWDELDTNVAVMGDVAIVYSLFMTSFELKGHSEPFDGEVRFTFALKRTSQGWRFIHAHESRLLAVDGPTAN